MEPMEPAEESDPTVVEVPGQDTTVVVTQDDGTAAAVAVQADEKADGAAALASGAAEAAVSADQKADTSLSVAERTLEELRASRAEQAEIRNYLGEIYREREEAREAQRLADDEAAKVKEVPVNDAAARERDNDSGDTAGSSERTAETTKPGGAKPQGDRGGLRRRH